MVSHLRAERERSAVAYRTVISHQARDCKSMRKKLQQVCVSLVCFKWKRLSSSSAQASADVEVFKKEQFRLEQSLQSCVMEVAIATQSVNESRSRERVSTRRIKAAIEREKEERRKSSVQYSKTILDLRRDSEQLMVELQSEKQNRAKDIKGIRVHKIRIKDIIMWTQIGKSL